MRGNQHIHVIELQKAKSVYNPTKMTPIRLAAGTVAIKTLGREGDTPCFCR